MYPCWRSPSRRRARSGDPTSQARRPLGVGWGRHRGWADRVGGRRRASADHVATSQLYRARSRGGYRSQAARFPLRLVTSDSMVEPVARNPHCRLSSPAFRGAVSWAHKGTPSQAQMERRMSSPVITIPARESCLVTQGRIAHRLVGSHLESGQNESFF